MMKYLFQIVIVIIFLNSSFGQVNKISKKGSKYAMLNQKLRKSAITTPLPTTTSTTPTTTEDPFFSSDDDIFSDFDDAFDEIFPEDELPACQDLTNEEIEYGTECSNDTIPAEPRLNDPIFERLLAQLWEDYQTSMNAHSSLFGRTIDPLDLNQEIGRVSFYQTGMGYRANITLHSIKMFGLSGINLAESVVTRNENLTDIDIKLLFAFDKLMLNGSYAMKGVVGWFDLDSDGEQKFEITMINATVEVGLHMDILDETSGISCRNRQLLTSDEGGNVVITEIRFPLEYDDVDFKFQNLGDMANTVVNAAGIYFLQTQEELLVKAIRGIVKEKVNSLIC